MESTAVTCQHVKGKGKTRRESESDSLTLYPCILQFRPSDRAACCSWIEDDMPYVCVALRLCCGRRQLWPGDGVPAAEPLCWREQPGITHKQIGQMFE